MQWQWSGKCTYEYSRMDISLQRHAVCHHLFASLRTKSWKTPSSQQIEIRHTHDRVRENECQPSSQQQRQNSQSKTVLSHIDRQHSDWSLALSWCPPIIPFSISISVAMATSNCLELKATITITEIRNNGDRIEWGLTRFYLFVVIVLRKAAHNESDCYTGV